MPEHNLTSVIIPTRNRAAYLKQALDSVYAQNYGQFEVIVIDDGSTDGTSDLVKNYDSRLRYYYQTTQGVSAARNNGIDKARGEFVAFLDDDDLWAPTKLQDFITYLHNNPNIVWLCSGFSFIDRNNMPIARAAIMPSPSIGLHDIAMFAFIHTSSVMVRAWVLENTGGFPAGVKLSEDYHLWAKLLAIGQGACLQKELTYFRQHPNNTKLPWWKLLRENTIIIDSITKNNVLPASRETYIANLHRIIAESLWYKRKWLNYILFRLFILARILKHPVI